MENKDALGGIPPSEWQQRILEAQALLRLSGRHIEWRDQLDGLYILISADAFTPVDWVRLQSFHLLQLLLRCPQLAPHVPDWSKLNGIHWGALLNADAAWRTWMPAQETWDGDKLHNILWVCPQFAQHVKPDSWATLTADHWTNLLQKHPRLRHRVPDRARLWSSLTPAARNCLHLPESWQGAGKRNQKRREQPLT